MKKIIEEAIKEDKVRKLFNSAFSIMRFGGKEAVYMSGIAKEIINIDSDYSIDVTSYFGSELGIELYYKEKILERATIDFFYE